MVEPSHEFDIRKAALAERIRQGRLKLGLSQEELADLAGVHRTYVGMLERRQANPSLLVLSRIASILHVSTISLITSPSEVDES